MSVDSITQSDVNLNDVIREITPKSRTFIPKPGLVLEGNPARKLSSRDRARLLKVFNQTRTGKAHFVVEVAYDKQTDAKPRINGSDYQAPSSQSCKTHIGLVTKADRSREGNYYITVLDSARANMGQSGWTNLRLAGIKSLKVVTSAVGPVPPKP